MGAIILAVGLGYAWLGGPGAVTVFLVGLWGRYGATTPWNFGGTVSTCVILFGTPLVAVLVWTTGCFFPDFIEMFFSVAEPWAGRALDFTQGDEDAYRYLAARGRLGELPAIRMGIAVCWLTAMPAAAATVLWHRDLPKKERLNIDFPAEKMCISLVGLAIFSAYTWYYGNSGKYKPLLLWGPLGYPVASMTWLSCAVGLRRWMNFCFSSWRIGEDPLNPDQQR